MILALGFVVACSSNAAAQIFSSPKTAPLKNGGGKNSAPKNQKNVFETDSAKVVLIEPATVQNNNQDAAPESGTNSETASSVQNAAKAVETENTHVGDISAGDLTVDENNASTVPNAAPNAAPKNPAETYRIGVGDVLDVRLLNANGRESTLFTVLENGMLDYPLAGQPVQIAGLTAEQIGELLAKKVKLYEKPDFSIAVREFASHQITLSGLVEKPGTKILRRDAVPLYAILAEAGQQSSATKVVIRRPNQPLQTIALNDLNNETLIFAGDYVQVINEPVVSSAHFYFVVGAVAAAGQKDFHQGLTLTQAIFAAGGITPKAKHKITIFRQNTEGLLVSTEYNFKEIKNGKVTDPALQSGDRIEVQD